MSIAELIQALQSESTSIDTQFQIWISVTFAAIIAVFMAREQLSMNTKVFLGSMYALAAAVVILRYANDASQFAFLKNELTERGVMYPAIADLRILRAVVYAIGTLATVVFVLVNPRRAHSRTDNGNSA